MSFADAGGPGGGVVVPEAIDAPSAPKRGPGRPRKTGRASEGARKITVRVSEEESALLQARAAALGVTEAEVLRRGTLG